MNARIVPSLIILCTFFAGGCSPTATSTLPAATGTLQPYHPATPTSPSPSEPPDTTPTFTPQPSPTPFLYMVEEGDTLLAIAFRFGVELNDLLAANPEINPRILSIGQEIIIPRAEGEGSLADLPTSTPMPVRLSPVQCYQNSASTTWCLATVYNPGPSDLEAISAQISLFDEQGVQVSSEQIFTPLNLLPEGKRMPLAVLFPDNLVEIGSVQATLRTAFPVEEASSRYIDVALTREVDRRSEDGMSWMVEGSISLSDTAEQAAAPVSLLLIAQDVEETIIGFRKWEAETGLEPGEEMHFEVEVFSLGPPINQINLLIEAPAAP